MGKLKNLVKNIRSENKISSDEIISCLTDSLIECDDECCTNAYIKLYKMAYGEKLTRDIAEEWVKEMEVTDGSGRENGQKWTVEQCQEVGNKMGVDWVRMTKIDWYVAMNMEYAKHFKTAQKFGNETDATWFGSIAKDEWCDNGETTLFDYYFTHVL